MYSIILYLLRESIELLLAAWLLASVDPPPAPSAEVSDQPTQTHDLLELAEQAISHTVEESSDVASRPLSQVSDLIYINIHLTLDSVTNANLSRVTSPLKMLLSLPNPRNP